MLGNFVFVVYQFSNLSKAKGFDTTEQAVAYAQTYMRAHQNG
jgi:hypothetical protein